jgi:hypothetical protein
MRLIDGQLKISSERIRNENIVKKEFVPDATMDSDIRDLLYVTLRLLESREKGEMSDEELKKSFDQSLVIVAFQQPKSPERGMPAWSFDDASRKVLLRLLRETQRIHDP